MAPVQSSLAPRRYVYTEVIDISDEEDVAPAANTARATTYGPLPIAECQARLRKSISLIPLVVFQQWRGSEIASYVDGLIRYARNAKRTAQQGYWSTQAKIRRKSVKPGLVVFKTFWLNSARPITPTQRRELFDAGWQDLVSWGVAGDSDVNGKWDDTDMYGQFERMVSDEWYGMVSADSNAKAQLTKAQYIWRQRLLLVNVEDVTEDLEPDHWIMKLDMDMLDEDGERCKEAVTAKMHQWEAYIKAAATEIATESTETVASSACISTQPGDSWGEVDGLDPEDVGKEVAGSEEITFSQHESSDLSDIDEEFAKPDGVLPALECQVRLRLSLSLIPLVVFQEWRGSDVWKWVEVLVRQTKDDVRTNQKIYSSVIKRLSRHTKPEAVDFKAFWLLFADRLTSRQSEHLEVQGFQDLASWDAGGDASDTNLVDEWERMQSAGANAKAKLSEAQYVWRQRLLLVKVEGVAEDEFGNWIMQLDLDMQFENGDECERAVTAKVDEWREYVASATPRFKTIKVIRAPDTKAAKSSSARPASSRPKTTAQAATVPKAAAPPQPEPSFKQPGNAQDGIESVELLGDDIIVVAAAQRPMTTAQAAPVLKAAAVPEPGFRQSGDAPGGVGNLDLVETALRGEIVELREGRGRVCREMEGLRGEVDELREERGRYRLEVEGLVAEVEGLWGEVAELREERVRDRFQVEGLRGKVAEMREEGVWEHNDAPRDDGLSLNDVALAMVKIQGTFQDEISKLREEQDSDRRDAAEAVDQLRREHQVGLAEAHQQHESDQREIMQLNDRLAKVEGALYKRKRTVEDEGEEMRAAKLFIQNINKG